MPAKYFLLFSLRYNHLTSDMDNQVLSFRGGPEICSRMLGLVLVHEPSSKNETTFTFAYAKG